MNKKQLITMWIGLAIVVLVTLFPPTLITSLKKECEYLAGLSFDYLRVDGEDYFQKVIRPVFIFSDDTDTTENKIQYGKLFLCQFVVSAIIGGLIVTFKDQKPKDEQKQ